MFEKQRNWVISFEVFRLPKILDSPHTHLFAFAFPRIVVYTLILGQPRFRMNSLCTVSQQSQARFRINCRLIDVCVPECT